MQKLLSCAKSVPTQCHLAEVGARVLGGPLGGQGLQAAVGAQPGAGADPVHGWEAPVQGCVGHLSASDQLFCLAMLVAWGCHLLPRIQRTKVVPVEGDGSQGKLGL